MFVVNGVPRAYNAQDAGLFRDDLAKRINSPELMEPCKPIQTPSRASLTDIPLDKNMGIAAITSKRRTFPRPEGSLYESNQVENRKKKQ